MDIERKLKGSSRREVGGGTYHLNGLIGGLDPTEGLSVVCRGDWRQGGELEGNNQSGSEKNLSQVLTQGSLRRLRSWEGSQTGMSRTWSR